MREDRGSAGLRYAPYGLLGADIVIIQMHQVDIAPYRRVFSLRVSVFDHQIGDMRLARIVQREQGGYLLLRKAEAEAGFDKFKPCLGPLHAEAVSELRDILYRRRSGIEPVAEDVIFSGPVPA